MCTFNSSCLSELGKDILNVIRKEDRKKVFGDQLGSPRAVGDAVELYLKTKGLKDLLFEKYGISLDENFGRRHMADMAFKDSNDGVYFVDVKTHNIATDFNMPNLTSVKRLEDFYETDGNNHFCVLLVSYFYSKEKNLFDEKQISCSFNLIESFDWSCLTLGALGWGQIQIANANNICYCENTDRKKWMNELCEKVSVFYDKEIGKIEKRKKLFAVAKEYWGKNF